MTITFKAGDQAGAACPSCGSYNTQPETWARDTAMIVDALASSAIVIGKLIGKTSPPLASTLMMAGQIGLAVGAVARSALGSEFGGSILRRHKCMSCSKEFSN
jgi:hypothetical protein